MSATSYHHGDLRNALLEAARDVLEEKGLLGFSLRETAKRAGVTASAPKHHFTDTRGLLTALSALAFRELADELAAADQVDGSRAERIVAQGRAYLSFSVRRRSLFELMWQADRLDLADPELLEQKSRAFRVLDDRVRGDSAPLLDDGDPRMAATFTRWSIVHGFAHLTIEGSFGTDPTAAQATATALLSAALGFIVDDA
jgi:AcrR family transcriptional regulator